MMLTASFGFLDGDEDEEEEVGSGGLELTG